MMSKRCRSFSIPSVLSKIAEGIRVPKNLGVKVPLMRPTPIYNSRRLIRFIRLKDCLQKVWRKISLIYRLHHYNLAALTTSIVS